MRSAPVLVLLLLASPADADVAPRAARAARGARAAFVSARRECRTPGPKLTAMVERVFDVKGFGARVITGWTTLDDSQRQAFDELASDVVGREERARAIGMLCRRGTIERAWEQADNLIFIDLHEADSDDCTQLMFHAEGRRWLFDGEWFCGKSIFWDEWRRRLGGGDYARAMAFLHDPR